MPENISPPSLSPLEPGSAEKRRRWVRAAVVTLVAVVLGVGASVAVRYIGGEKVGKIGEYFRQLPLAQEGRPRMAEEPSPLPTETPRSTATPTPEERYNLEITVRYHRQPKFTLEITGLKRTGERPDISNYALAEGIPYSRLQVLDEQGQVIVEEKFQMETAVALTGEGIRKSVNPIYQLEESGDRFIVPGDLKNRPAKVRLVTAGGELLDEQTFKFEELAAKNMKKNKEQGEETWQGWLTRWLPGVGQALGAAPGVDPDRERDRTINIVVVGSSPRVEKEELEYVACQLDWRPPDCLNMQFIVDPWNKYRQYVQVGIEENTKDLGCMMVHFPQGDWPVCPYRDVIKQKLEEQYIEWDILVIVMEGAMCGDCGSTVINSMMLTVDQPNYQYLAHMLGHAVASLAYEYFGDLGLRWVGGPNCFDSPEECEKAVKLLAERQPEPSPGSSPSPEGACTRGCNNPDTFRPASLMMYRPGDVFGPIERCLMKNAIVKLALAVGAQGSGLTIDYCVPEGVSHDAAPIGPGLGWYREY